MHAVVLKYFVEVARRGSMRKAVENLFVASSAVNRQILRLEDELGTELFDRVPTGIRLNAAGELLLQHVRTTLHDFHLMRSELDALKGERKGHVSVAAMDSLLIDFLPTAVEEFTEAFPAVQFTILSTMPTDVPDRIESGDSDIGISCLGKLHAGLHVVAKAPFPLGVVMAPSHPLARKTQLSFDDCRGHAMLQYSRIAPMPAMPEFTNFWDGQVPAIRCNSTTMIKRMLVAGRGIAFFSKVGFVDELEHGEVVWRSLANSAINAMEVGIIISSQRTLSHVATQFLERIIRRLKQLELSFERGLDDKN